MDLRWRSCFKPPADTSVWVWVRMRGTGFARFAHVLVGTSGSRDLIAPLTDPLMPPGVTSS